MRTPEQKIKMAPLLLTFGKVEYPVKVLGMTKSDEWRTLYTKTMDQVTAPLMTPLGAGVTASQAGDAMTAALLRFPNKLADLVFAYAPNLAQEAVKATILEDCTDEQMVTAFQEIWEVANPFLTLLGSVMQMQKANKAAAQNPSL